MIQQSDLRMINSDHSFPRGFDERDPLASLFVRHATARRQT